MTSVSDSLCTDIWTLYPYSSNASHSSGICLWSVIEELLIVSSLWFSIFHGNIRNSLSWALHILKNCWIDQTKFDPSKFVPSAGFIWMLIFIMFCNSEGKWPLICSIVNFGCPEHITVLVSLFGTSGIFILWFGVGFNKVFYYF